MAAIRILLTIAAIGILTPLAQADRLKDLTSVEGVRNNQLIGYGLVVGLNDSGDSAPFTDQTFRNLMTQFGIAMPEDVDPSADNVAAVSVTAQLKPFASPGEEIDITVSSMGNAESLRGGTLLMTPLKGADGQTYAMAQGNLVVGGFGAEGGDGSSISVNVPSVGRIPQGATVEREVPDPFAQGDSITLNLREPDFTTARRVVDAVNDRLGNDVAYAENASSVKVRAPRDASQRVSYLSILENIEVEPAEARARVVINSRTGTIVVGENVRVSPAAVTHGNLSITINENPEAVAPGLFGEGEPVVVPETDVAIEQEEARMFRFGPAVTLNEIVQSVNQVGAAPGDVMAVLEALKTAGALRAELIVI